MRILITNLKDKPQKSGVGYYVNDLYKLLKKYNVDVKVLIPKEYAKNYEINNIDIVDIKEVNNKIIKWLYYTFLLPIKAKQFDIVHYSSEDIPIIWHRIFNTLFNKKQQLIMTIHDLGEFKINRYSKIKDFLRRKILIPLEYRSSNKITTVSKTTKKDIEYFFGKNKDIYVCYSTFNSPKRIMKCNCDSVKNKFNIHGDYFLYVSQINHPSKNHLNLIKSFEKLYELNDDFDYELVFIGTKAYGADVVLDYLNNSDYKDKIHYLGYVNDEDLFRIFECSSFYIFPSFFEGFGRGVLEAWFYEKPLICSNRGSLEEVAQDGALYINPDLIDDMVEKVLKIVNDKKLQIELVEKGKKNLQQYSEDTIVKQFLNLYKEKV